MNNKKIAVIGKGTAGAQAVIHFNKFFPDHEIDWYFNPNRPAQAVGEGSVLILPRNLYQNLGFTYDDLESIQGTFKRGIYKEGWGAGSDYFYHNFPPPSVGFHFNAVELQEFIENKMKNKINIIAEEVDYKNVDADFVMNASGKPDSYEEFYSSEYIPVNAAYVTQCFWDFPRLDYTLTLAAKHGWVFGIPLRNRLSIGYLYNSNFASVDDLHEELEEIFSKYGVTPSDNTNSLKFNNYYRKNNYEDNGRIVHNGNASFFLEPLEATSIGVMDKIQRDAFDIWTGNLSAQEANGSYLNLLHQIELVITLHYAAGSKFNTPFWDYAQSLAMEKVKKSSTDVQLNQMLKAVEGVEDPSLIHHSPMPDYGLWPPGSFVQNIQGLGLSSLIKDITQ